MNLKSCIGSGFIGMELHHHMIIWRSQWFRMRCIAIFIQQYSRCTWSTVNLLTKTIMYECEGVVRPTGCPKFSSSTLLLRDNCKKQELLSKLSTILNENIVRSVSKILGTQTVPAFFNLQQHNHIDTFRAPLTASWKIGIVCAFQTELLYPIHNHDSADSFLVSCNQKSIVKLITSDGNDNFT